MISKEEYESWKKKIKGDILKVTRYNFIDENEHFRLDIFKNSEPLIILERDVTNTNRQELPKFIKKALNITHNRDYNDDSIYVDQNIEKIYQKNNK